MSSMPSSLGGGTNTLPLSGSAAATSPGAAGAGASSVADGSAGVGARPAANAAPPAAAAAPVQATAPHPNAAAAAPVASTSNPYPFAQGDTFDYAYVATHSVKAAGKPLNQTTTTGTIVTTIGATGSFDGQQLTDVKSVLTYQTSDPHKNVTASGTTTTDRYETFAQAGSGLTFETYGGPLSGSSTNSNGASVTSSSTTTYGAPFVLDEIPEIKNANWSEAIAYVLNAQTQTTLGGVTTTAQSTYTRNADGSYTRSLTRTTPGKATFSEQDAQNADGSGQDQNDGNGADGGTTTFSAPALVNGAYLITVARTPVSGPPVTTTVPDWFPGNGPAQALTTDQSRDLGQAQVPKKCGSTAGQTARELRETLTDLDVVRGTYNVETIDTFVVAGAGTVCIDHQRLLDTYDNRGTGQLSTAERFNETIGLSGETLAK
jgi:hypothetical protein